MADFSFTKEQLELILSKVSQVGQDLLKTLLQVLKDDGLQELTVAQKFASSAQALLADLIKGNISQVQYRNSLDDLALAFNAHLISVGYNKSREYIALVLTMLKNIASVAISVLL